MLISKNSLKLYLFNKNALFIYIAPFVGGFLLYYFDSKIAICPLMSFTNTPCPFCGLTRAFVELSHLKVLEAISYNIFVLIFAFILFFLIVVQLLPLKVTTKIYLFLLKRLKFINILVFSIFIFMVIFNIFRIVDIYTHYFGFRNIIPQKTLLNLIKSYF